jgi:hypothetical protein
LPRSCSCSAACFCTSARVWRSFSAEARAACSSRLDLGEQRGVFGIRLHLRSLALVLDAPGLAVLDLGLLLATSVLGLLELGVLGLDGGANGLRTRLGGFDVLGELRALTGQLLGLALTAPEGFQCDPELGYSGSLHW